jgi:hypothetical protein
LGSLSSQICVSLRLILHGCLRTKVGTMIGEMPLQPRIVSERRACSLCGSGGVNPDSN